MAGFESILVVSQFFLRAQSTKNGRARKGTEADANNAFKTCSVGRCGLAPRFDYVIQWNQPSTVSGPNYTGWHKLTSITSWLKCDTHLQRYQEKHLWF